MEDLVRVSFKAHPGIGSDYLEGSFVQVTVSQDFEILIPQEVREALRIVPGQKLEVLYSNGQIHLVPSDPPARGRGFLRGIETSVERDDDRV